MKGFHPTPAAVVDSMVEQLFDRRQPSRNDKLLDPGSGEGAFIDGVLRWCAREKIAPPQITGIESDPKLVEASRRRFASHETVRIEERDFLTTNKDRFQFIVGNPPYVAITGLSESEKERYRTRFLAATGRFDLYFLFFEKSLGMLERGGQLVFITPEKFLYVESAKALRELMAGFNVRDIQLINEDAFPGLITYPTITRIQHDDSGSTTRFVLRDGTVKAIRLPTNGESWMAALNGEKKGPSATLAQICQRISAGVATGADEIFVRPNSEITAQLKSFAYPTLSGKQIADGMCNLASNEAMLVPYSPDGTLLAKKNMRALMNYLEQPNRREHLAKRTCVSRTQSPKEWYAFHETPQLHEIMRPKIICKDIAPKPIFVPDYEGEYIPRHSVYYIVPHDPIRVKDLLEYLRSETCTRWLMENCQRASNDYIRVQSSALKRLPVPPEMARQVSDVAPKNANARRLWAEAT